MFDDSDRALDNRLARVQDELAQIRARLAHAERESAALRARTAELLREVYEAAAQSRRSGRDITSAAHTSNQPGSGAPERATAAPAAAEPAPAGLPPARLRRVASYIDASLAQPLTVSQLAAVAGMSASHFAALFKRSTGLSPHEFVLRRRISRAGQLLADPAHGIADVAFQLGFCSQAHFTTMFRKRTGVTPSQWRLGRGAPRTAPERRCAGKISADIAKAPATSESRALADAR